MGRGRAKAKQTKVARQLKYTSRDIDLERLCRDLTPPDEQQQDDGHDAATQE